MGIVLHTLYIWTYLYFSLPLFILVFFGKPKFIIVLIHKILQFKEPFSKIRIFRFLSLLCFLYISFCLIRSRHLFTHIDEFLNQYDSRQTNLFPNIITIDEKLKEAHILERNAYMFFTFVVLLYVIDKLCHMYFELWKYENNYFNANIEVKYEDKSLIGERKSKMENIRT